MDLLILLPLWKKEVLYGLLKFSLQQDIAQEDISHARAAVSVIPRAVGILFGLVSFGEHGELSRQPKH